MLFELISKYKFIICALRNYNFISREKFKPGLGSNLEPPNLVWSSNTVECQARDLEV